jgi:hypothetical protein
VTYLLLLIAVATLPLMDLEVLQVGGRSVVLPWMAALLLVVALLPNLPRAWRGLRRDRGLPLVLGWACVCALCSIWAYFRHQRVDVLAKNATQLSNLALMVTQYALFAAALGLLTAPGLARLLRRFVDVAVLGALYSLYQLAAFFQQWPGRDVLRNSTLYLRAHTVSDESYGSWINFPRPYGTAPEPSFWGGYLMVAVALAVGGMVVERRRGDRVRLALLVLASIATLSRGVLLTGALIALAAAALRWMPRVTSRHLTWALAAVLVLTLLPAVIGDHAGALLDRSSLERISTNRRGLRIFLDHLVTGAGFGTIEFLAPQYAFVFPGYADLSLLVVHNAYLLVLASTGLLGGAFFLGFLRDLLRAVGAALQRADGPEWLRLRTQAALAMVAVLGFWLNTPAYNLSFTWFALALAGAAARPPERPAVAPPAALPEEAAA